MQSRPIGVFDSGVGGISTLKKLSEFLPNEHFIFYGDSLNAPYGNKSTDEVYQLCKKIVDNFVSLKVKAIVIACNTATSAAKNRLIIDYPQIPIVGIEPALKEAVDCNEKNILVMGTTLTMNLPKYQKMVNEYKDTHHIYSVACPGLAESIERVPDHSGNLKNLLDKFLIGYRDKKIEGIVLGCTHYPFIEKEIRKYFYEDVCIHTGYQGLARQVQKTLARRNWLNENTEKGSVTLLSSKKEAMTYYHQLFDQKG